MKDEKEMLLAQRTFRQAAIKHMQLAATLVDKATQAGALRNSSHLKPLFEGIAADLSGPTVVSLGAKVPAVIYLKPHDEGIFLCIEYVPDSEEIRQAVARKDDAEVTRLLTAYVKSRQENGPGPASIIIDVRNAFGFGALGTAMVELAQHFGIESSEAESVH